MMEHPGFFERAGPFPLRVVAEKVEATLAPGVDPELPIADIRTLADAGPGELSFLDNRRYLPQAAATKAGACLIQQAFAQHELRNDDVAVVRRIERTGKTTDAHQERKRCTRPDASAQARSSSSFTTIASKRSA